MNKEKEDTGKKNAKTAKSSVKSKSVVTDERIKFVIGILITGFALYLLLACVAYLFWWKTDLSIADSDIVSGPDIAVKNWAGKSGHFLAKMIITNGFGFGAFFIPLIFGCIGLYLLRFPNIKPFRLIAKFTFTYSWFYLQQIKCLPWQRTGRCAGLSCCEVAERFHGNDRNRSYSDIHYNLVHGFCVESQT